MGIDLLVEKEAQIGGGGGMVGFPIWYLNNSKYVCVALGIGGIGQRLYRSTSLKSSTGASTACPANAHCCDGRPSSGSTATLATFKKNN
jgi:hypothetical protein